MLTENLAVNEKQHRSSERYFWRGKRVTEKVYNHRLQQQQLGKSIRSIYGTKNGVDNLKNDTNIKFVGIQKRPIRHSALKEQATCDVEGRRIVHIKTLGEQMICKTCTSILSLSDITDEKQRGLASIFYVKCRGCNISTEVHTDKRHAVSNQKIHFDTNTKAVIG